MQEPELAATEQQDWHALSGEAVVERLASSADRGLDESELTRRQLHYGPNRLHAQAGEGWYRQLLRQFCSVLIFILLAAAGVSWLAGERLDAAAILLIVVLNALLGFVQEWRAERSIAALRQLLVKTATVLRSGRVQRVDRALLVPGDVVVMTAGDQLPADIRVLEGADLEVDESAKIFFDHMMAYWVSRCKEFNEAESFEQSHTDSVEGDGND